MDKAHQMYFNKLRDSKELVQALQWFDTRDREYFQCRTRINEVKHISDRMSLVSSRSSKRSSSSIRSKRAKAAARAACLEVEMDFLEREAEYKRLVMLKEIAKAKAEEEAMRKIEEEEENFSAVLKSETLIQDVTQNPAPKIEPVESNTPKYEDNLNAGAPTFVPLRKLDTSQSKGGNAVQSPSVENTGAEPPIKTEELSSVVKMIAEQQQMSLLPVQRPPVFSGNYFDYAAFINAFESLIESRVTDPKQRLYYPNQYTAGDAKESIKGLITLDSTNSYEKARKVLKERFGHPYRVAQVYMEKLNSWSAIREGDDASLQQFSDFLVLCEQAMKTLKYMEGLNSEDTPRKVTSKLPSTVGIRWCHLANKMLRYEERLASFHDMIDFVKDEAALASDPVFSPDTLKEARKNEAASNSSSHVKNTMRRNNGKGGKKSATSFSTSATPQGQKPPPRFPSCPFCNSYNHDLDNCPNFH